MTGSVVAAIAPKVRQAELERSRRKPTESLDAYDYYLRGLALNVAPTKEFNDEALRSFSAAIELDSEFARREPLRLVLFTTQGTWLDGRSRAGNR